MKRLRSILVYRLGRRGAFLLFLALLDSLYGYSIVTEAAQLRPLDMIIPVPVWGWVWIVTGCLLPLGAFVRRDRLFFGWSTFVFAAWAGTWVSVWVHEPQIPRVWINIVVWGAFAALVVIVSTWPEVKTLKPGKDGRIE